MNSTILSLSDPAAVLENVGGKGMSLTRMINAGLPVPDGFHVTTEAYRRFVAANGIQERILRALEAADAADTAALERVSQTICEFFAAGSIPQDIAEAVTGAYARLNDAPVAVRSSATAEDLPGASFAGQQETYLNIRGKAAVLEAVKKCWASLWTARAIAYRIKNDIDQGTVALAVVVQELVFADAAGIMFTVNPVSGSRSEVFINAAWGLGEAVVSGAVTPDTTIVDKTKWRIVRREVAEKQVMTVRTEHGTHEQPVPIDKKHKAVLTLAQAKDLARLGVKIEQFYEMPMDIEWAFANGQFAIVQARPITALPVEWVRPDTEAIYARGSLAEHTPSPVTPLFATLGLEIANATTARLWERMVGKGSVSLMPEGGMYTQLNGYVFGGVHMQGMNFVKIMRMSFKQLGPMFRGSVARWQAARKEFAAVVAEWEQKDIEAMTPSQLLEGVYTVFGAATGYFNEIQTVLPAASMAEVIFVRFYDRLIKRKNDPEATTFLLGFESRAVQAEKSLYELAMWAKGSPRLAEYLLQTPSKELGEALRGSHAPEALQAEPWDELRRRFERHLDEFGRTAYEFDFANPTPAESPEPLLDAVKGYIEGRSQNPAERQRESVEKREQATQAVLRRVGWPRKGWFEKLLHWAQDTGPMREDSIFDMGMGHPLVRRMFHELGSRFAAGGAIEQADDIYWLEKPEVQELIAALEGGRPLPVYSERIPERKAQWQSYLKVSPPVILPERSGWGKMMHGSDAVTKDGKVVLKGVGTSSGVVVAPARVVFGPEDFATVQPGDVLVAVTTTPAWTPLFSLASAVVTDIGGPLSHSSIVAREYGIPAVMAARGATRAIQSGQMVRVDGSAGTVTLEP